MSILHLFLVILGVLMIALVLTVINWIFQAKISSRIAAVEKELEKKTLELDSLRKEKATAAARAERASAVETVQPPEQPIQQQTIDEGAIQIVRNVRGTFSTASSYSPVPPAAPYDGQPAATAPDDSTRRLSVIRPEIPRPPVPPAGGGPAASTIIPLFSAARQGPDFTLLYDSLVAAMKTPDNRPIALDFSYINSLSDPELDYVEKICLLLAGQQRRLSFMCCSPALTEFLQRRPLIAALLRQRGP